MIRDVQLVFAEGLLDRLVAVRLLAVMNLQVVGSVTDAGGGDRFWQRIQGYNKAAAIGVIFALADHDSVSCVGPTLAQRIPKRHSNLVLRLAVPEIEAWLLSDVEAMSRFLGVSVKKIPTNPDAVDDPKREIVNLARRSARAEIRDALVPDGRGTAAVGSEYTLVMSEFIEFHWRPHIAARRSESLRRAMKALCSATGVKL